MSSYEEVLKYSIKTTTTLCSKIALEQQLNREINYTMKKSRLKIGDKVTYIPSDIVKAEHENGIVKSIPIGGALVFVVFHCNNEWDKYMNYTAESVSIQHLRPGWDYEEPEQTAADDYLDYLDSRY